MSHKLDDLAKGKAQSVTRRAVLTALAASLIALCPAEAGMFHATGTMNSARYAHTATLLPGGKVLVVGGYDTNDVASASAELYDPATRAWTITGPLNTARGSHTATMLPNGKVLIAGGDNSYYVSSPPITSAELYDPATGIWVVTGAMHHPQSGHTATLLPNGKVLAAGGSAELYDPVTSTWTETGALIESRWEHTATLLGDGKVLVATGGNYTAEVYDPAIGNWISTGELWYSRWLPTATLLSNGQVLVAGGLWAFQGIFARDSVELYDPTDGTWTTWSYPSPGALITGRGQHTATLLFNGRVLVTGGLVNVFIGVTGLTATAEEFDPVTGVWRRIGNMAVVRDFHTATLLANGQVLIAGGETSSQGYYIASAKADLYDADAPASPTPQPTTLTDAKLLANGSVQFAFTNTPGAVFSVLATTFPTLPLNYWMVLGGVTEIAPGQFQFTDVQATNYANRFYRLRSP